jgi:AraC-like DNA-binding protein
MRQLPLAAGIERLILLLEMLRRLAADSAARPLASAGFHPAFNQRQAHRIERVCEWLTLHFREPISLAAAARVASLTPAAFSRLFHRATNRPFTRFLNELRIGHACRLLLETDQPIAQIAFESGYENLSNFNRRFRELKHTAPRDFRQAATAAKAPPPRATATRQAPAIGIPRAARTKL